MFYIQKKGLDQSREHILATIANTMIAVFPQLVVTSVVSFIMLVYLPLI
jgi:hypothetical protein